MSARRLVSLTISLVLALPALGCGRLAEDFVRAVRANPAVVDSKKSAPFFGISSASGLRTSGAFELNGGIGSQASSAVKSSGGFTLYGGIQGQMVTP